MMLNETSPVLYRKELCKDTVLPISMDIFITSAIIATQIFCCNLLVYVVEYKSHFTCVFCTSALICLCSCSTPICLKKETTMPKKTHHLEVEHQYQLLEKWTFNLHHVELQMANYGGEPPIHLINIQEYIIERIHECKGFIQGLKKN